MKLIEKTDNFTVIPILMHTNSSITPLKSLGFVKMCSRKEAIASLVAIIASLTKSFTRGKENTRALYNSGELVCMAHQLRVHWAGRGAGRGRDHGGKSNCFQNIST